MNFIVGRKYRLIIDDKEIDYKDFITDFIRPFVGGKAAKCLKTSYDSEGKLNFLFEGQSRSDSLSRRGLWRYSKINLYHFEEVNEFFQEEFEL